MKKLFVSFLAVFAIALTAMAQDRPTKIISGHPDFKINVTRCAASGNTVIMDLTFLNNSDNDVVLGSVTAPGHCRDLRSYDDQGNEYSAEIKVSNKEYVYEARDVKLLPGVARKVSLKILNVSNMAESLPLTEIACYCETWGLTFDKPIQIRNIHIQR